MGKDFFLSQKPTNPSSYVARGFNVFDIYKEVFGYTAAPFPLGNIDGFIPDSEKFSKLGTALFRKDDKGREAFCPVVLIVEDKEIILPFSTVSIASKKIIVKTPLIERRGSATEVISCDDYSFKIQGIAIDNDNDLPESDLETLAFLEKTTSPIRMKNAFTDFFLTEDDYIVLTGLNLPDMKGISGAQAYSITATSDSILELEIKE